MKAIDLYPSLVVQIARVLAQSALSGQPTASVKSLEYYDQTMHRYAHELYNDKITDSEFLDKTVDMVRAQIRRAWNEGMRVNKLDPVADMEPEWQTELNKATTNELNHLTDLIDYIQEMKPKGEEGLGAVDARVDLWVIRYKDVVNRSKVITAKNKARFMWVYGDTQAHCSTCAKLNGKVLTADEWRVSSYRPQSPPNPLLECGGWRCLCSFKPTRRKRTGL